MNAKLNDDAAPIEDPYITLKEAAPLFGMTFLAAQNAIYRGYFPVPTQRRGRHRVVSKKVVKAYLRRENAKAMLEYRRMRDGGRSPSRNGT
jgi:predicted site-specific integrase-resolvase